MWVLNYVLLNCKYLPSPGRTEQIFINIFILSAQGLHRAYISQRAVTSAATAGQHKGGGGIVG